MQNPFLRRLLPLLLPAAGPLAAQVDYAGPGVACVQDFNLPAAAETALLAWSDNVTFPGWFAAYYDGNRDGFAAPENIFPTAGLARNEFAFYLYRTDLARSEKAGPARPRVDAALGAQPSDARCPGVGSGGIYHGVALANRTGRTLTTLRLGYRVELWRLSSNADTQTTLSASCRIGGEGLVGGEWIPVPGSVYTTPRGGGGEGSSPRSVDGNAPENVTSFTDLALDGLALAPGQTLWIRWFDVNNRGADHGIGLDDVRIVLLP